MDKTAFKKTGNYYSRKSVALFMVILVLVIIFETFQQWYYIQRYDLGNNVQIVNLFKGHFIGWLIWLGFSPIILWQIKRISFQRQIEFKEYIQVLSTIIVVVLMCVFSIAFVRSMISVDTFTWEMYFGEYVSFFFFQKLPIYTLSYIALGFVFYLNFKNASLMFRVQELSELRMEDLKMYQELRTTHTEKAQILNIKIGNKRKIIPADEIYWIESDDYCVKVHTIHNKTYTMRSTLKALEEQLSGKFMRVHRTALVNLDFAREVSFSHNPNVVLKNNSKVPVTKSKIRALRAELS